MSGLATIRHTVRTTAARTRRTVFWTPGRFRFTVTLAAALLLLVPVVSLAVRQPWRQTAAAGTAPLVEQPAGGVANGLEGPSTLVPAIPTPGGTVAPNGATPNAPVTTEPVQAGPLDPTPLAVRAVLAVAATATTGPDRTVGGAGQPTLSPGAATDRWKAQARTTAVRFSQAWLAGEAASGVQAWLTTLDPWLDPAVRDVVALTNLEAIPRTRATTVQLVTLTESEATSVVALEDGGRIDLTLGWDGERWRVTDYEPVASPGVDAPAATATGAPAATVAPTTAAPAGGATTGTAATP